jgi:SH3-like domain-containing protein
VHHRSALTLAGQLEGGVKDAAMSLSGTRRRWLLGWTLPLLALALLLEPVGALAQAGRSTGLPVPRFVSLNSDEVNVRFGPGREYPVKWMFQKRELPVIIVDEFDTWRRIRDHEGEEGWIHSSLLSSRRTIMVLDEVRPLRRTPDENSRVVLRAEPNVLGRLFDCDGEWCRVEIAGQRGWLKRSEFFGTLPGEPLP